MPEWLCGYHTGEFAATELSGADIQGSVAGRAGAPAARPRSLHPETLALHGCLPGHATPWPAWRFEPGRCQETILRHFEAASLDGFGLRG